MDLKVIRGQITAGGGIVDSGGITSEEVRSVNHDATGQYTVDLEPGTFAHTPTVVATLMTGEQSGGNGTNRTISVTKVNETQIQFGIRVASAGNEASDRDFAFHAIAPSA